MLRSIDFKTMPYLFTDKAGTCLTVDFDERELDDIYKQVKTMYDQAHPSHPSDDMPTEPGWYATRDGEDLLSYDGDAWHIHNIDCDAQLFADGDLETMDWSVVKRTFDADAFPLVHVDLEEIANRRGIQEGGYEMSSQYKVCPLFWADRGSDRRLVNMEALEELLNEGWKILRVDTMPPTELRDNAVTATNVYILEREANDD